MQYESIKFITEKVNIDISFPFFMARHRKYTYAKFLLDYYEHDKSLISEVIVIMCEYGFNINPIIQRKRFYVVNNLLPREFIYFYNDYEHIVTEKEFKSHFNKTLKEINK